MPASQRGFGNDSRPP